MGLENIMRKRDNLNPKRQISYVLTYKWVLYRNQRKNSLQFTIPENLDNRETYMDLIYIESRKRQDLLNKLGAWGPWERVEGEGREREVSREKCIVQ